jgi:DNA-binding MarR family transcriptional regulator
MNPSCRRQDEQDARVVRVYLTEKGDRMFPETDSRLRQ